MKTNDLLALYVYWFDAARGTFVSVRVFEVETSDALAGMEQFIALVPTLVRKGIIPESGWSLTPVLCPIPQDKDDFVVQYTATLYNVHCGEGVPLSSCLRLANLLAGHFYDGKSYLDPRPQTGGGDS